MTQNCSGVGGMVIDQPVIGYDCNDASLVSAEVNPLTGGSIKTLWVGTQAQYDAIATKDANTQYNIVA